MFFQSVFGDNLKEVLFRWIPLRGFSIRNQTFEMGFPAMKLIILILLVHLQCLMETAAVTVVPVLAAGAANCTAYLDFKGRKTVSCKEGGIVGPLNIIQFGFDTEVLKITAPDDNMNSLTMSPLESFKKLEEVHITKSNIPQLGQLFFYGLSKLEVLNLTHNNITQPLDHNFRGLFELKELYLDDNRIISLPSGTFRYLPELRVLSIQRNRISELVIHQFLENRKLKILKLNGNNLGRLKPQVFKDIQELRSLECRGCALDNFNEDIYHLLPHLNHLDLGDNNIRHVRAAELKHLHNLKHLKLDGNHITAIKGSPFVHLKVLRRLSLARNGLTYLTNVTFSGLDNLTELDLGYNKLEELPYGWMTPVQNTLQILILSGNHLKMTSYNSLKDSDLTELYLVDCGIAVIHYPVFPNSLSVLSLAGNHLTSLPSEVIPRNLDDIDLSRNRFHGLDELVVQRLENIRNLKLDQNPWACDLCHIVPLHQRINRSAVFFDIRCAYPYTVKNLKLGVIERLELTWCTASSYGNGDANFFLIGEDGRVGIVAAGMSVCLLFLTLLAIIAALFYSRRHAAKYYTHEDKLAVEGESIFENHSPLFCDGELSFKFPLDGNTNERKISVATIDKEIKKDMANGMT